MNIVLAIADFLTQVVLVVVGMRAGLLAGDAREQRRLRHDADGQRLPHRDPGRDGRLHRHRDDLEHGRGGARTTARRSRARCGGVVIAVMAISRYLPAVALSAMPVVNGETLHAVARRGRLRGQPDPRRRQEPRPRVAPARGGGLRRHPGRDDPAHRHERGADRRVAPDLLDGPVPPAARAAAPAPPEVPHALHRDHRVRRRSPASIDAARARPSFLGTIYAFGAMLSFTMAHLAVIALRYTRAGRASGPGRCRATSGSAASMPLLSVFGGARHAARVRRRHAARTLTTLIAGTIWLSIGHRDLRRSTAAAWGCR